MERSGTEHPEGYRLRIAPIELADYLKRKEMVVRTGTNEILYAVFHRWAEPLDAGIRRVLADDLRAATGIDDLLPDKASQESSPAYTASIRILACEGVHLASQDSVEFVAQWQLTGPGAFTARGTFRMKPTAWREMDYDDLAHHLSEAVDELSRVLLHAIALHDSVPSGMIKTLNRGAYYWREVLYCRFNAPGRAGRRWENRGYCVGLTGSGNDPSSDVAS